MSDRHFFNLHERSQAITRDLARRAVMLDVFSPPRDEYMRSGTGVASGT